MLRTDVIPVEREETIQALVGKLRERTSPRIIIFSPTRVPFLRSEINLRLLKYYSEEEDKELILVVKDRAVKKIATKLGIKAVDQLEMETAEQPKVYQEPREQRAYQNQLPMEHEVFQNQLPIEHEAYQNHLPMGLAELAMEAVPAREGDMPLSVAPFRGGRLLMALGVTCFSLLVAAYFLFRPRLNVIVHPTIKDHRFHTVATVGANFGEREVIQGKLPIKVLEKQEELNVSLATTGRKRVGHLAAKGTVVFINSGITPIIVPKGTVVSTKAGVKFITAKPVVVPKKTTRYELGVPMGEVYGQSEVEVEAVEKGTIGNVEKQMITKIEGHLANTLHVVNSQRFTSGEDRAVAVVQEEDLRRAEVEAKRQVTLRAESEVKEMVEEGYLILPELTQTQTGQIRAEQALGTESSTLAVKLTYKIRTCLLSKTHLYKWLEHNLARTLPEGFRPISNEIACREVKAEGSLETAQVSVLATAKIRGEINREKIRQAMAGKSLQEAKATLAAFPEVGLVEFTGDPTIEQIPKQNYQVRLIVPSEK